MRACEVPSAGLRCWIIFFVGWQFFSDIADPLNVVNAKRWAEPERCDSSAVEAWMLWVLRRPLHQGITATTIACSRPRRKKYGGS